MILLKSELKAKGCFPTALNFLFQCQMPCAEIARSRRQGSSPAGSAPGEAVGASAPRPHARASLFSQCNLTSENTMTEAQSYQLQIHACGSGKTQY